MANLHGTPDTLYETMARESDLCPQMIVSSTWPTPPGSGLTIPAFATEAYVRRGETLYYVNQPAVPVSVANVAGNHWLGITADTWASIAGWSRVAGSHYVHIQSATQPAGADGLLGFAQVVVSAGNVTTVTPLYTSPVDEAWRQWLNLGTMSMQNADAVAITGGSLTGATSIAVSAQIESLDRAGSGLAAFAGRVTAGPDRWNVYCDGTAQNYLQGPLSIGVATPEPNCLLSLRFLHATTSGIITRNADGDTAGPFQPLVFLNQAGGVVGSISTTATATTYATSSDRRLKRNVTPLEGALATLRQVTPVKFLWNSTEEYGEGFIADDLQKILPFAVTGTPDAVNADGSILPMGIDFGKIVPMLTQAVKELLARVEHLETQLGL